MRILSRVVLSVLTVGALVAPVATGPASAARVPAPTTVTVYDGTTFTPSSAVMKSGTRATVVNIGAPHTFVLEKWDPATETYTTTGEAFEVIGPFHTVSVGQVEDSLDGIADLYQITAAGGTNVFSIVAL